MKRILPTLIASVVAIAVGAQTSPSQDTPRTWADKTATEEAYARLAATASDQQITQIAKETNDAEATPERVRSAYLRVADRYLSAGQAGRATLAADHTMETYYATVAGARGATQVSQAANQASLRLQLVQVGQNQRIIELLEKLAAQPKK